MPHVNALPTLASRLIAGVSTGGARRSLGTTRSRPARRITRARFPRDCGRPRPARESARTSSQAGTSAATVEALAPWLQPPSSVEGASALLSVTATCDPGFQAIVSVSVVQSNKKLLVRGSGSTGVPPSGSLIVWQGTPHVIPVRANITGTTPLKKGRAEVTATISQNTSVPPFQSASATVGPQVLVLEK